MPPVTEREAAVLTEGFNRLTAIDRAVEAAAAAAWAADFGTDLGVGWAQVGATTRKNYMRRARIAIDAGLPAALGDQLTLEAANIEVKRLKHALQGCIDDRNAASKELRRHVNELPELLRIEREATWAEAYPQGVEDERTSVETTDGQVGPNRANPHAKAVR
jgi:hypothetical protein